MKHPILIDTREKRPWSFERFNAVVELAALKSGDYSLKGFHNKGIAIERKSFDDLFGSMTSGRLRFYSELRRLSEFGMAALIVEADEAIIRRVGNVRTRVNPQRMLGTLYTWCMAFDIQLHFCCNKEEAEEKAYRLLCGWLASRDFKCL